MLWEWNVREHAIIGMARRAVCGLGVLLASAWILAAQPVAYYFVQISVRNTDAGLQVRSGGGKMTFTGNAVTFEGQAGTGNQAATALSEKTGFNAGVIGNPFFTRQGLRVKLSADGNILVGSSTELGSSAGYDLMVAVRQGAAAPVNGNYGGAYFAVKKGEVAGLSTAFLDFASSSGRWNSATLVGHTATRDDVNREEHPANVTYTLDANGAGVLHFPAGSDFLSGDRQMMASADGKIVLGYSLRADERDIFVALRREPDRTAEMLRGLYGIAELTAQVPFAFDAGAIRWSAAMGSLYGDGASRVELVEQVAKQGAANVGSLVTANTYYSDSAGHAAFVPELGPDRRRNNLNFSSDAFVGAQVGAVDELTLEHGIAFGVRPAPFVAEAGWTVNPMNLRMLPAAPMGFATLYGRFNGVQTASAQSFPPPKELGGVQVVVDGAPALLQSVSQDRIQFQWPVPGDAGAVEIKIGNTALSPRLSPAGTLPGVFRGGVQHANGMPVDASAPAKPGETLTVYAAGIDPKAMLQIFVSGLPAKVESSAPAADQPGVVQIKIVVPSEAATASAAPLGLAAGDAFVDLADFPIAR